MHSNGILKYLVAKSREVLVFRALLWDLMVLDTVAQRTRMSQPSPCSGERWNWGVALKLPPSTE